MFTSEMSTTKRLEIRLKDPNPKIRQLLENWLEDETNQTEKAQNTLKEALDAIKCYPLPITSGQDCAVLKGFGPALCKYIDQLLFSESTLNKTPPQKQYEQQIQEVVKSISKPKKAARRKAPPAETKDMSAIKMIAGCFKIYLIIDVAETKMEQSRAYFEEHNILHEVRKLSVGDFIWLARDDQGKELVLPYIIERKRMDDLDHSIRDGRFHEQKHRLKSCGITNVIYLFENMRRDVFSVPLDSLKQAMVNTQVHEDYHVVRTAHHNESMEYLKNFTKSLIRKYAKIPLQNKINSTTMQDEETLCLLEFSEIYKDSARNSQVSIQEIFIQQLLQLHSLTLEKAIAIVTTYPTPKSLLNAYKNCADKSEGQKLLSNIRYGPLMRAIGPKLSLELYEFYETIF